MAAEGGITSEDGFQDPRRGLQLNFNDDRSPSLASMGHQTQIVSPPKELVLKEAYRPSLASMGHPTRMPFQLSLDGDAPIPPPRSSIMSQRRPNRLKVRLRFEQVKLSPSSSSPSPSPSPSYEIERLRSHSLESTGKLKITDQVYDFTAEDLIDQGEIGRGAYGTVNKVCHEKSGTVMAVKRIRSTVDEKEQKQLLMDLDVVMRSNDCPCIVQFYGALFKEGDCWICMELMSVSLDKFYKFVYSHLESRIPEEIIGKVTVATLKALSYLKDKLKIIHRDVKPSNILMDQSGNIKLCDFGISGQLVDSIAKTRDAGCRPYMAPERIDPRASSKGYDVRSDVWSLGITLVEVSTGKFPYPKWNSVFDQLTQVVQGEPPSLQEIDERFSPEFITFVNTCLIKDQESRPKYNKLLRLPFIRKYEETEVDVAGYVCQVLEQMPTDPSELDAQMNSSS